MDSNSNNDNRQPAIDFLDVTNQTQLVTQTTPTPPASNVVNMDILKNGENIWRLKGYINQYQKGVFLGKGDHSNILFQEFLKKLRKTLEEIIREELKTTNQTSETFKDEFKTLECIFNIIISHLASMKIEIKDEKFLAILHGFINSYVDSTIHSDHPNV